MANFQTLTTKDTSTKAAFWYDDSNHVLKVKYPNGIYLYDNVPPDLAQRIRDEKVSVGTLVRNEITTKPTLYPCAKI